ncbi:hypothetical protein Ppa06_59620 [Planomonospora parontospora subsp. parontospora]|uniref:Uncharacterized protein n=2 Tax=Planomonospora parontospora TaxID=58119 RepID=A0AA37F7C2_9ACTN|nr:hypothetical protein GCM10010126_59330 [Planomonospora parontospora]GII12164.1 hypothetical protein Ppa06_59620 [Planomonospora parontospora subsp. parontospora]
MGTTATGHRAWGPATLFSALAIRDRRRRYELPEEKVIVG